MTVLNEPSEFYIYSGITGESDVNVTLINENMTRCKWEVKNR